MSDDPTLAALARLEAGLTAMRSETTTPRDDFVRQITRRRRPIIFARYASSSFANANARA